jgi:hypothetical protein
MAPGRIEFVILRTGRSPPAALHHASPRRSGIRLQAGERLPEEDFHLFDYARFQAHFSPTFMLGISGTTDGIATISMAIILLDSNIHL